ncbi:MAG: hypothetical protein R3C28_18535 [Pirellulaceae bacterium]
MASFPRGVAGFRIDELQLGATCAITRSGKPLLADPLTNCRGGHQDHVFLTTLIFANSSSFSL